MERALHSCAVGQPQEVRWLRALAAARVLREKQARMTLFVSPELYSSTHTPTKMLPHLMPTATNSLRPISEYWSACPTGLITHYCRMGRVLVGAVPCCAQQGRLVWGRHWDLIYFRLGNGVHNQEAKCPGPQDGAEYSSNTLKAQQEHKKNDDTQQKASHTETSHTTAVPGRPTRRCWRGWISRYPSKKSP